MRVVLLFVCWAAAAANAQPSRARIRLPGYRDPIAIEDVTVQFELNVSASNALAAFKGAFADLGVPLDVEDPTGAILGNQSIKAVAGFGGYRLSRLLDCGSSTVGQNSDTFRVSIVLLALLDWVDSTHTKVRVGFVGGAVPIASSVNQGVQCSSTGVMEARLMELASKRLQSPR